MSRVERVRILTLSDVYFPRVNGVSTSIQTFQRELDALGHRSVIIAPDYGQGPPDERNVVRVASRRVMFDPEDRMMRRRELNVSLGDLRAQDFDLVHIQTPFVAHYAGVQLARRMGVPCVETYHTFFEEYLHNYVPFLPRGVLRAAARRFSRTQCNAVNAVVVPSWAMRDRLSAYGVDSPMEVIPTGIDASAFSGGDGMRFRRAHGIAEQRPVLVYVGRVAHEKNIGFLLDMLPAVKARVPDVLLVIAGEGPAEPGLKRKAVQLGLAGNVQFVGYLARSGALQDCYRAGDVFVFASRTETQGLVLLEAMALGVPVVSTAVMGTAEVLDGGRGCVVAQERVEDFAAKTTGLLLDADLRRRLGDEAHAYAAEWLAPALAQRLCGFYQQVLERSARKAAVSATDPAR